MAKKKSGQTSAVKKSILKLDQQLLKLINERAQIVKDASEGDAQIDIQLHLKNTDFEALSKQNKGPIHENSLHAIYREVESGCRAISSQQKVAYLGPQFSYSHQAAIERFGQCADLVPVATIAAVFEEIDRNQADFGLVPVENSNDGRVTDTLDMFAKLPVKICGEVQLHIHHNLLAMCQRAEIKEVYSKPQAISQCRNWLAKHLPQAKLCEMTSTAAAAQLAAKKPGIAAIASRAAGINYQLNTVAANIEDNQHNVTRFAVIGHQTGKRTGDDKTTLMFQLEHKPGALADAMTIFKRHKLNLTWIESFPLPGKGKEYLFFVEMQGHQNDLKLRKAIASLEKKSVRLDTLGSYQNTEPIE
ncbi:MAG: prephenate dehydratase [Blastopirellula sp.]|nr:MAG: prephenate dehydratase [Blastopirellula sp.]